MVTYSVRIPTPNRPRQFEAQSLDGLRASVEQFIADYDYGMSDVGGKWSVSGHPDVTHLSYNGRFWNGDKEVRL